MSAFFSNDRAGIRAKCAAFLVITVLSAAAPGAHEVERGETLYSISRQYGLELEELCALNSISPRDTLKIGQELVVSRSSAPGKAASPEVSSGNTGTLPLLYTVARGDTFYSISKKYGVGLDDLLQANGLKPGAVLKADQVLRIPGRGTSLAVTESPKAGAVKTVWPVTPTKITYIKGKVTGVQLTTSRSHTVTSVSTGTVVYSSDYRGFGTVVFVKGSGDYVYGYSHLGSVAVKTGDKVVVGSNIGRTSAIGGTLAANDTSERVTFMVYRNGTPVDPATAPRV